MNIKDFEFKPNCPPKVLDAANEWLKKNSPNFSSTANFAVFDQKGKAKIHLGRGCHWYIGSPDITDRCVVATANGFNQRQKVHKPHVDRKMPGYVLCDEEEMEKYLRWFLYDSFASPFILNRDDYDTCRNHGFVISADIPAPLLQNICIMTRHFYECGNHAYVCFNDLVRRGYPGMFAYLLSFCSSISSQMGGKPLEGQIFSQGAHRPWHLPKDVETLNNLITGEFGETFKVDCSANRHYRNYATIMGGVNYGQSPGPILSPGAVLFIGEVLTKHSAVKDKLSQYRKEGSKEQGISNPFKLKVGSSITTNPLYITYKELVDVVGPFMIEQGLIKVG